MSTVVGSGRMRFPAIEGEAAGLFGSLYLGVAGGTGPLEGGVYRPAHWAHNFPGAIGNPPSGISGLWQEVIYSVFPGDPNRDRILGMRALGTGVGSFDIILSPGGVWVGSAGEEITVSASIALNGVVFGSQSAVGTIPGWVIAIFPDFHFVGDIPVIAGDVLTAGVTVSKTPAMYAYSSGTGQQTRFVVSGTLAPEGAEDQPSWAMRGSGAQHVALA
jgi:hypothetical protein